MGRESERQPYSPEEEGRIVDLLSRKSSNPFDRHLVDYSLVPLQQISKEINFAELERICRTHGISTAFLAATAQELAITSRADVVHPVDWKRPLTYVAVACSSIEDRERRAHELRIPDYSEESNLERLREAGIAIYRGN